MSGGALAESLQEVPPEMLAFRTLGELEAHDLAGRVVGLRIDGAVPAGAPREMGDYKLEPALSTLRLLMSAESACRVAFACRCRGR